MEENPVFWKEIGKTQVIVIKNWKLETNCCQKLEVSLPKNWKLEINWKFCCQKLEAGNKLEVLLPKLEAGYKLEVLLPKIGSWK